MDQTHYPALFQLTNNSIYIFDLFVVIKMNSTANEMGSQIRKSVTYKDLRFVMLCTLCISAMVILSSDTKIFTQTSNTCQSKSQLPVALSHQYLKINTLVDLWLKSGAAVTT